MISSRALSPLIPFTPWAHLPSGGGGDSQRCCRLTRDHLFILSPLLLQCTCLLSVTAVKAGQGDQQRRVYLAVEAGSPESTVMTLARASLGFLPVNDTQVAGVVIGDSQQSVLITFFYLLIYPQSSQRGVLSLLLITNIELVCLKLLIGLKLCHCRSQCCAHSWPISSITLFGNDCCDKGNSAHPMCGCSTLVLPC